MADQEITLMKGNEAIAHAAIRCGCDGYFGYPITPQSEVLETLAVEKTYWKRLLNRNLGKLPEWLFSRLKVRFHLSTWSMVEPAPARGL